MDIINSIIENAKNILTGNVASLLLICASKTRDFSREILDPIYTYIPLP